MGNTHTHAHTHGNTKHGKRLAVPVPTSFVLGLQKNSERSDWLSIYIYHYTGLIGKRMSESPRDITKRNTQQKDYGSFVKWQELQMAPSQSTNEQEDQDEASVMMPCCHSSFSVRAA